MKIRVRLIGVAVALVSVANACGVEQGDALPDGESTPAEASGAVTSGGTASGISTGDLAGRVAPEACKPSLLGEGGDAIGSIYAVVDGELAGRCFGQRNDALIDAWTTLAAVTPREQRRLVVALAGVKADSDSLAFTTPVDDAQSRFAIAVNTNEAKRNPQELRLTIVHELAHVLTLAPGQLTQDTSASACKGYGTDAGCFVPDSYIAQWVAQFWSSQELRAQPSDGSSDQDLGDRRCAADRKYLGPYAASSPEEDFAESFSAFVFDIDVPAAVKPKMAFFQRFPALVAHRDLRRASGLPTPPNTFEGCG